MTDVTSDLIQQTKRRAWVATGLFVGTVAFVSLIPQNDRAIWDIPRITSAFAATPFADERYAVEPITLAYRAIAAAGRGGPFERDPNRARLTPLRRVGTDGPGAATPAVAGVPQSVLPSAPQGSDLTGTDLADLTPTPAGGGTSGFTPGGYFPGFGGGPGTIADVDPTNPTNPTDPTNPTNPTNPTTPGVPEPSAWVLMISGFALVGAGLRGRTRRRRLSEI